MKEKNAVLIMLFASFIWGLTFAFQSQASETIGPFMFNGIRMILGVLVLSPLFIKITRRHKGNESYFRHLFIGAGLSGIATAAACVVQQYGIGFSSAGKSGFLTSLYTLFVPIISVFLKKKIELKTWICVAIGVFGAFLLSYTPGEGFGPGDLWLVFCGFLFAVQMMTIDHYVPYVEGIEFSCFQFFVSGMICLSLGLIVEPFEFSMVKSSLIPLLYSGIMSCGVAYTLQIIGQKWVSPTKATLALSPESAWAAIGGVVILNETMTTKEMIGCVLIFSAVLLSQLKFSGKK